MSVDGSIVIEWGGEEISFRLAIGEMRQLYEIVNRPRVAIGAPVVGPMELLSTLQNGNGWPEEVRAIIRLGLIGAGMKPDRAMVLLKQFVEPPGMLLGCQVVAYRVLLSALAPSEEDEPVGKKSGETNGAAMEEPTGSVSFPSTEQALQ